MKNRKSKTLKLGKSRIGIDDVVEVCRLGGKLQLEANAKQRIERAHKFLAKKATSGEIIYGVNTGFGLLSNVKVDQAELKKLQINLLRSHAVGTGAPLPIHLVRAMLFLRIVTLIQGHSGVSLKLVDTLIELFNREVSPWIPEQGSVGASGDLAPLAHLALVLIGEGKAYYKGKLVSGKQALKLAGIKPIELGPKEGLALINGTQFMNALGIYAVSEAKKIFRYANLASAMTLEALRGTTTAFDSKIQKIRPHSGQIQVAQEMRTILNVPKKSEIAKSHAECDRVQDPYSLRCIPQVHGASLDTLKFVENIIETEINSVTDNPLVFEKEGEILSGGNFHGQYLALAMDFLSIASAEIASISEQRIEKLVNPAISGLPAFLTPRGGINSGFMIVQVAAASIVSENKTLCHPASVDSIPTSADKEDHVSMGAWASRKALKVIENTRTVIAMELLSGAQGIDLLRPLKSTPRIEQLHSAIRKRVPFYNEDASFYDAIESINQFIQEAE